MICLIGLVVLLAGGVLVVRQWRGEVIARRRFEEENAQLKALLREWEAQARLSGQVQSSVHRGVQWLAQQPPAPAGGDP